MRPACAARPARGNGRHVLDNYLPILIFLAVAGGFGLPLLALGRVLGPRPPDGDQVPAYGCGFEPSEAPRSRFAVRFSLGAILFIIFALAIAFLFPWAVSLDTVGGFGLMSMGVFLAVLVVGFIYEWKKGALEWD